MVFVSACAGAVSQWEHSQPDEYPAPHEGHSEPQNRLQLWSGGKSAIVVEYWAKTKLQNGVLILSLVCIVAIPFTLCHLIYWKYFFKMEYTVIHMKKSGGPTAVCQVILVILTYFTKRDTPLVLKRTYWKGNKYQRNSKISMVLHTDNCLEL